MTGIMAGIATQKYIELVEMGLENTVGKMKRPKNM